MRRASIADIKGKLSVAWLGNEPVEVTANNVVVATIYPSVANEPNSDPRVPARTGVAAPDRPSSIANRTDPRVPRGG